MNKFKEHLAAEEEEVETQPGAISGIEVVGKAGRLRGSRGWRSKLKAAI